MSISIGGASLVPQQLAAPQQKQESVIPADIPRNDSPPPKSNPPETGRIVDKTV